MSEKDWILIYTTNQEYEAELAKEVLEENEIEVFMLNKKDSFYVTLGEIELYVLKEYEEAALEIIKSFEK